MRKVSTSVKMGTRKESKKEKEKEAESEKYLVKSFLWV